MFCVRVRVFFNAFRFGCVNFACPAFGVFGGGAVVVNYFYVIHI
jgi:hypothetical protein